MTTTRRRRTALITGASSGIGEELAGLFAGDGFDLVLVARTEHKLHELGRSLAGAHGIHHTVVAADLSDPTSPAPLVAQLEADGIHIDALVNNAGFATYGRFVDSDLEGELRMLQVNVVALTHLTWLLLPEMVARRSGRILNVASTAAFMPGPLMAVYYASKAYVLSFSEALADELRGSGVSVTALCPGPTRTGFQARARMEDSKLVRGRQLMDAATVARAGYAGLIAGDTVVIPGMMNRVQAFLPRLLPRAVVRRAVRSAQERTRP
jgi:short-subunit dehydrogenase